MTIDAIAPAATASSPSISMTPASSASSGAEGLSFAQVFESAAGSLRQAESAAMAGLRGEAPSASVVQSILEAERSFHTALAIRDKLVSAWQEVSRMAI